MSFKLREECAAKLEKQKKFADRVHVADSSCSVVKSIPIMFESFPYKQRNQKFGVFPEKSYFQGQEATLANFTTEHHVPYKSIEEAEGRVVGNRAFF